MDEASALILLGRQVLANRRLQRQRELLKGEENNKQSSVPARTLSGHSDHLNHDTAAIGDSDEHIRMKPHRNHDEERHEDEKRQKQGSNHTIGNDGGPFKSFEDDQKTFSDHMHPDVIDIMQLKQRVEAARRCVEQLNDMSKHNDAVFRQRKAELERMLEESRRHRRNSESASGSSVAGYVTRDAACGPFAAVTLSCQSPMQQSPLYELQEPQFCRKQQLKELLAFQKALISSKEKERVAGMAVATLTECAHDTANWDNIAWGFLREALQEWKLRLLPRLRRFYHLQDSPLLSLPQVIQPSERKDSNTTSLGSLSIEQDDSHDVSTKCLIDFARCCGVAVPPWEDTSYPLLDWLEKQKVNRAIDAAIDALARASSETAIFCFSLMCFSDQKDVKLIDLLAEVERKLQLQEGEIDKANTILGELDENKIALETEGAAIDATLEQLQRKFATLSWHHEQQQLQERELQEELLQSEEILNELRQKLEKEVSLKNDAKLRTEEHGRFVECVLQQKAALDQELQRLIEKRESMETKVRQLRAAARVVQEEKEEILEQRKRQCEELRIAQLALETSTEAFMQRKKRHEMEQVEFVSVRCHEHELQGQLIAAEEACNEALAEVEARRAAESTARDELAQIRLERAELQKEVVEAQKRLHSTNKKLKAAQEALLYDMENITTISDAAPPPLVLSPVSNLTLAEVLRPSSGNAGRGIETSAQTFRTNSVVDKMKPDSNTMTKTATTWETVPPRARSQAAELALAPRDLQRDKEKFSGAHLHLIKGGQHHQQQQQLQSVCCYHSNQAHEGVLDSSQSHQENLSMVPPSDDNGWRGAEVVVVRPSCRSESTTVIYAHK